MYIDKEFRPKIGKQMDDYLRNNINYEEAFWNIWASMGMPDDATEEDYAELAEDDNFWTDCLEAFMRTLLFEEKMCKEDEDEL